ncbi:hypothetical protein L3X38_025570 [Prunus dulcis]|uniref:Uncharacterized protein n=1 Tax=Prunus dulcis TaxID=3755 RepID=A0AAD4Z6I2_PRUDU|nr:hypothetical protein L3X38_025570 [Prunus dulcis]
MADSGQFPASLRLRLVGEERRVSGGAIGTYGGDRDGLWWPLSRSEGREYFDPIFFVTTPIRVYSMSTDSFRRALRNGASGIAKFFLDQKVNFFPIK